jgi:hypothetical protein
MSDAMSQISKRLRASAVRQVNRHQGIVVLEGSASSLIRRSRPRKGRQAGFKRGSSSRKGPQAAFKRRSHLGKGPQADSKTRSRRPKGRQVGFKRAIPFAQGSASRFQRAISFSEGSPSKLERTGLVTGNIRGVEGVANQTAGVCKRLKILRNRACAPPDMPVFVDKFAY